MSENAQKLRYVESTQPEIIRQNEKDNYYQSFLKDKIIDAAELFTPWIFSYRTLSKNDDAIKMIAGLIYYGLTTMRSVQTLGEEYTQLAQYNPDDSDVSKDKVPELSPNRKALYIFCAVLFPFISNRILRKYYAALKQRFQDKMSENSFCGIFIKELPDYDTLVTQVSKAHIAAFLIEGVFLQISRRIAAIRMIFIRKPQDHGLQYKNIGIIMGLHLFGELCQFLYRVFKIYRSKQKKISQSKSEVRKGEIESENEERYLSSKICTLCFERRKNPSCTPCGHIFCWDCILKQSLVNPECPQCRKPCKPNKIIQLLNYE